MWKVKDVVGAMWNIWDGAFCQNVSGLKLLPIFAKSACESACEMK